MKQIKLLRLRFNVYRSIGEQNCHADHIDFDGKNDLVLDKGVALLSLKDRGVFKIMVFN
jgi:hypothetical protein